MMWGINLMIDNLIKRRKFAVPILLTIIFLLPTTTAYAIVGSDRAVSPPVARYVGLVEQWYPGEGWLGVCSASLISPQIMLTAAHCVLDVSDDQSLRVRLAPSSEDTKEYIANVTGFIYHTKYEEQQSYDLVDPDTDELIERIVGRVNPGESEYDADIALLYLDEPVSNVKFPKLARTTTKLNPNWRVYGWGATSDDGVINSLNTTFVFDATEEMSRLLEDPMDNMLGAYYVEETGLVRSTCYGDSGGPLVDGNGAIIGITSFALVESCLDPTPTVYLKVANYRSWIYRASARLKGSMSRIVVPILPPQITTPWPVHRFWPNNRLVILNIR